MRSDLAAKIIGLSEAAVLGVGAACLSAGPSMLGSLRSYESRCAFEMVHRNAASATRAGTSRHRTDQLRIRRSLLAPGARQYWGGALLCGRGGVCVTSLISHVPGGLGVIKTVVLYLLPNSNVIGALIAFRVIYFLIPLCIGGPLFALTELLLNRHKPAGSRSK